MKPEAVFAALKSAFTDQPLPKLLPHRTVTTDLANDEESETKSVGGLAGEEMEVIPSKFAVGNCPVTTVEVEFPGLTTRPPLKFAFQYEFGA